MIRSFIMPPAPVATSETCSFEPVLYSTRHTPHQHDIPLLTSSQVSNPASLNIRIALDVDDNTPQTLDMTPMYDMMGVSGTGGKK